MKHALFLIAATGLLAGCGGSQEAPLADDVEASDAPASSAQTINLDDYGFIGEQMVSPIAKPDWLPDSLALPDDTVAVYARTVMPGRQQFYGITKQPADGLFDTLAKGLRDNGYEVRDDDYYRSENLVYFGGNGYEDSTIRIRPGPDDTLLDIGLVDAPE